MYSHQSPRQSFDAENTLSFTLHPSLLPPTLSHAPSIAFAAAELKESMSVGRLGGERKKRREEDIRKNSFSEFLNKKHGLHLHRLARFSPGLEGGYLGQPLGLRIHLVLSTQHFQLGST